MRKMHRNGRRIFMASRKYLEKTDVSILEETTAIIISVTSMVTQKTTRWALKSLTIMRWIKQQISSRQTASSSNGVTSRGYNAAVHEISHFTIRLVTNLIYLVRPFTSGRRYFPSRDAGVHWFNHIGLKTKDAPRDEKFWCTLFNLKSNDWIGDAALMSFDKVHHRIALFPTNETGVQHINFQVRETDDLMRSSYFLKGKADQDCVWPGSPRYVRCEVSLFRRTRRNGLRIFMRSKIIEPEDQWRPRQFPFTPESFCVWGSKPDIPEFRD